MWSDSQRSPDGTNYQLAGEGESTLVFIHGVGLNHQVWQPQVDYFTASGYQVLRYDMLGHGKSRQPDAGVTLDDYVAQLARLLDHTQIEQANVIGHSMGALISVAFALAHPNRVSALVPMNIVYQRTPSQRVAVEARAEQVLASGQVVGIEAALARWFADEDDPANLEKIAAVRQWMSQVDPIGYGRTYQLFATSDEHFVGHLHELTMPVLYLTGENDPNSTPAMSHQMAAETPYGQAEVIANEAHMMAYIHPNIVNPILANFLTVQPPRLAQVAPELVEGAHSASTSSADGGVNAYLIF